MVNLLLSKKNRGGRILEVQLSKIGKERNPDLLISYICFYEKKSYLGDYLEDRHT